MCGADVRPVEGPRGERVVLDAHFTSPRGPDRWRESDGQRDRVEPVPDDADVNAFVAHRVNCPYGDLRVGRL